MDKEQKRFLLSAVPSRYVNYPEPTAPPEVRKAARIVAAWDKKVTQDKERKEKRREARIAAIRQVIYIEGNAKKAMQMIEAMKKEKQACLLFWSVRRSTGPNAISAVGSKTRWLLTPVARLPRR